MSYYGVEDIRIKHNLNKDSIVFEVGGWHGHFSQAIISKFDCNVFIFEPLQSVYDNLVNKYKNNPKVKVYNFGLDNFTGNKQINICGDGSSLYKTESNNYESVQFKNINETFEELNISKIDLMELNCEGAEYNILKEINMINLEKIKRLQIQFHNIDKFDINSLKQTIYDKLNNTHNQQWQYSWFECWERNKE